MTTQTTLAKTPHLNIDKLVCGYQQNTVAQGISFALEQGEIGCLLGPSGCGKTTILRAIAGFIAVDQGQISVNHRILSGTAVHVAPEKRHLGMVYQDYALFPHLSVADNIQFGINSLPKQQQRDLCTELLGLIKMQGYENSYPAELSGGQQQRVALARSLAVKPDILLLDEPFSSLDVELRRELSLNVRDILKQRGCTALLVTHDQEEAFAFADRVGVMNAGKLLQWGSAYHLYHHPSHRFVADFVGRGNFFRGRVVDSRHIETELGIIEGDSQTTLTANSEVELLIRPDDVLIDDQSPVRARINSKLFVGTNTLYSLKLKSGNQVETMLPSHEDYEIGSEQGIRIQTPHLITFELTSAA